MSLIPGLLALLYLSHGVQSIPQVPTKNCVITMNEVRKSDGHCSTLANGHMACITPNDAWMDPTNPQCRNGMATETTICMIQQEIKRGIPGKCRLIGRIPSCVSMDGTAMDVNNLECDLETVSMDGTEVAIQV